MHCPAKKNLTYSQKAERRRCRRVKLLVRSILSGDRGQAYVKRQTEEKSFFYFVCTVNTTSMQVKATLHNFTLSFMQPDSRMTCMWISLVLLCFK